MSPLVTGLVVVVGVILVIGLMIEELMTAERGVDEGGSDPYGGPVIENGELLGEADIPLAAEDDKGGYGEQLH